MKLLVLSDSHGERSRMCRAVELEQPAHLVHLGDHYRDGEWLAKEFPHLPCSLVPGNCDFVPWLPAEQLIFPGNTRVLLCHGHTLGVKQGLLRAAYAGRERGAELVLFGHTHVPLVERTGELWLVNPGSIGRGGPATYAVVQLQGGVLDAAIRRL